MKEEVIIEDVSRLELKRQRTKKEEVKVEVKKEEIVEERISLSSYIDQFYKDMREFQKKAIIGKGIGRLETVKFWKKFVNNILTKRV